MKAIIADDELQARKRLTRLLGELDVEVVAACATAEEVRAQLPTVRPDVLVLDISMPGLGGLGLAKQLGGGVPIIFVTAHAEHAVDAFEAGVVDYVMKPVTGARLAKAIARVRNTPAPAAAKIPIDTRSGVVLGDPSAIIYARFDGTLVTVVTAHESWLTTTTLKDLERLLPTFERVDRRHLLNLDEVTRLVPDDDGGFRALVRSGEQVPVSRQAGRDLRKKLGF